MTLTRSQSAAPPREASRARLAVAVLFFTNGAIFAGILPRYPEIKETLGLTNAAFGAAVAAYPLGALLLGLLGGVLIRRLGSARVAVIGTPAAAIGIFMAATGQCWLALAGGLFVAGAMDSITDVAQNSHGLRVQRLYKRSILNSFHAVWSVGAVAGGALGALAAELGMARTLHLGISGIVFSAAAAGIYRLLLAGPEPVEADISLGFIALQGMQFIGRLLGDRLIDRFGQRLIARLGGLIVMLGMSAALLVPGIASTIIGFGLAGLGVATLIPAAMHAADELPGFKAGAGLTIVSWLMRVGFLVSPPVIGAVADASELRYGLLVMPLAGLLVVLLAGVLTGKKSTH